MIQKITAFIKKFLKTITIIIPLINGIKKIWK